MKDLAKYMTDTERPAPYSDITPKDASTLILVDRSGATPKVLLGKRHHNHVFMPGKFVFPGGRTEAGDELMPIAKPLDKDVEIRLMREVEDATDVKARALAAAAIRETFEETGLVLGARHGSNPGAAPEGSWAEFTKAGFYPDLSVLHFIARAITPPRPPRRFDTRFFSVDASSIAHKVENVVHAEAELVELVWLPIPEALELDAGFRGLRPRFAGSLLQVGAQGIRPLPAIALPDFLTFAVRPLGSAPTRHPPYFQRS
jgi:8-oxo-dGTP pyrophosphatase MutT (NUDIX family)